MKILLFFHKIILNIDFFPESSYIKKHLNYSLFISKNLNKKLLNYTNRVIFKNKNPAIKPGFR